MSSGIIYALILIFVQAASNGSAGPAVDELDMDYSNEYDDVRPHLVYPDEPRLDKQILNAAREIEQSFSNAWQAMVDSFRTSFEELKNFFNDVSESNENSDVFSMHA